MYCCTLMITAPPFECVIALLLWGNSFMLHLENDALLPVAVRSAYWLSAGNQSITLLRARTRKPWELSLVYEWYTCNSDDISMLHTEYQYEYHISTRVRVPPSTWLASPVQPYFVVDAYLVRRNFDPPEGRAHEVTSICMILLGSTSIFYYIQHNCCTGASCTHAVALYEYIPRMILQV